MPDGTDAIRQPRVDPAGRPLEGRRQQAITALSIVISWICLTLLIFWATQGAGPPFKARFFAGMAVVAWLCAESVGRQRGLVWPASALAIVGSLSLGFAVGLSTSHLRAPFIELSIAVVSGVAALSMAIYLFRFRLPGLVSPIITFGIVALFLSLYGVDPKALAQVEGLSPRGILAALIRSPLWMALFGLLAGGAMILARRLDLNGDDFGVASARPLHIIGAGVTALIVGRMVADLPLPLNLIALTALWLAGYVWSLRINRIAVLVAIHFAITKPLVFAIDELVRINSLMGWEFDLTAWTILFTAIFLVDLVLWFWLHKLSLSLGWTLGPGGRIPRERDGWMWRYWPYA